MRTLFIAFVFASLLFSSCGQSSVEGTETDIAAVEPIEITYQVVGMTCTDCEESVKKGVNQLEGIKTVEASFTDSTTHVVYDPSKTNESEIIAAIEKRGYSVNQ